MNSRPPDPNPFAQELPPLRRPLVAVLPFDAADTEDEGLRLLGSELADALREQLARTPALNAILISSEFLQQAPPHAIELVCRQLRVGHLVSGRCYRNGAHASLYVELSETRQWHVRCARFLHGNAHDLLDAGSETMASLQAALQLALFSPPMR
ncbi:MAG TPA: hypothetical protein VLK85_30655 [Ramlibacter sp.]|nr:hypothetical protein [Ramlibacter sp.]